MNHSLPITDGPNDQPPVYDCRVVLTPPTGDDFSYQAFAGNLPEITATGPTERDCLRDLVALFKEALQNYRESGEPIPWTEPPIAPTQGQQQRWIPVHL
jgi:predicted RNase H-like HicB family nuclease